MEEALDDLKEEKFVVVVDDEGIETREIGLSPPRKLRQGVNLRVKCARGLVCMPIIGQDLSLSRDFEARNPVTFAHFTPDPSEESFRSS